MQFSKTGGRLALGSIDGLVEIYETLQYTLDTTLKYQAEGVMIYHDESVQHAVFNNTDEIIATVDIKGLIKVWNMESGRLLRKIATNIPVSHCIFGNDPAHFLVAHQNVQLYGIRSCNILKEYICSGDAQGSQ